VKGWKDLEKSSAMEDFRVWRRKKMEIWRSFLAMKCKRMNLSVEKEGFR